MNGRSWVGKKGRILKDNVCTGVKHHPYAYSDMIPELNSITSLFTEKQKHMAESTGFKLLSSALRQCINTFFEGWEIDWENWATVYTTSSLLSTNAAPR
jgi:hypothetical protein